VKLCNDTAWILLPKFLLNRNLQSQPIQHQLSFLSDTPFRLQLFPNDTMLLTIRNLTEEPIAAYTYPSASKFTASLHTRIKVKPPPASEFLLQPSLDFTTTFPKGIRRELILWRSQDGLGPLRPNSSHTVETAGLLDKEWQIHPKAFKIQVSVTFAASWQLVKVPQECPWRVYTFRVCNFSSTAPPAII